MTTYKKNNLHIQISNNDVLKNIVDFLPKDQLFLPITQRTYNKNEITDNKELHEIKEKFDWNDNIREIYVLECGFDWIFSDKTVKIFLNIVWDKNEIRTIILNLEQKDSDRTDYEMILEDFFLNNIKEILASHEEFTSKFTVRIYKSFLCRHTLQDAFLFEFDNTEIGIIALSTQELNEELTEHILCFDVSLCEKNFERARNKAYNLVNDFSAILSVVLDVGFKDIQSQFLTFIDRDIYGGYVKTVRKRTGFVDENMQAVVKDNFFGIYKLAKIKKGTLEDEMRLTITPSEGYATSMFFDNQREDKEIQEIFSGHRIYKIYGNNSNNLEGKDMSDEISEEVHFVNEKLKMPKQMYLLLEKLKKMKKDNVGKYRNFIKTCRMYNASKLVASISASMEISYLVGSIDSLSDIRDAREEKRNYSQLCKQYNPGMSKKVSDYAYSIRSSHFHGGKFFFSEYDIEFYSKNDMFFSQKIKNYLLIKSELRKVLIFWLKQNLLDNVEL